MAGINVVLGADYMQFINGMNMADTAVGRLQATTMRLGDVTRATFSTASFLGLGAMVVGIEAGVASLDKLISRYNTLAGLDKATNFYNARQELASLAAGAGDVTTQAMNATLAIKMLAAGMSATPGQWTGLGQVARGLTLAGIADPERAYQAEVSYIVGGRSQMAHMLGIMSNANQAYRDYGRDTGINPLDLTQTQKMQARLNDFLSQTSAMNKANFGSATEATAFQTIGTFMGNVNDAKVRSLAGAIEELARSIGLLDAASGTDKAKSIGQMLGVLQPLGQAGLVMAGAGMWNAWKQGPITSALAGQQSALTGYRTAASGFAAEQDIAAAAAASYQLQAQTAIFGGTGYSALGTTRLGQAAEARAAAAAAGKSWMGAEAGAVSAEANIAGLSGASVAAAGFSTAIMGVTAVLAAGAAAAVAYGNVMRNEREANQRIGQAGVTGSQAGYHLEQMATSGATPAGMIEYAKQQGLSGAYLGQMQTAINSGLDPAKFPTMFADLLTQQEQGSAQTKNARTGFWDHFWHGVTSDPFMMQPDDRQTVLDRQDLQARNRAMRGASAYVDSQKNIGDSDESQTWWKIRQSAKRRQDAAAGLDTLGRQMGITGDVKYADQELMSTAHQVLNFDASGLTGKDKSEYDTSYAWAQRYVVQKQLDDQNKKLSDKKQTEIDAYQKKLDDYKADTAIDMKMAQTRDGLAGANVTLLQQTNVQAERVKEANALLTLQRDAQKAVADGSNLLALQQFAGVHSQAEVNAALRTLNDSSLDLAGKMRTAAQSFIGSIPGMLGGAVSLEQARYTGQAGVIGAFSGKNDLIEAWSGLAGRARAIQPQYAQYSMDRGILDALNTIDKTGKVPGGWTGYMNEYLQQYARQDASGRLTIRGTLASQLQGEQTALTSAQYGLDADYGKTRGLTMGMKNTPESRANLAALQQSGIVGTAQMAYGEDFTLGAQYHITDKDTQQLIIGKVGANTLLPGSKAADAQMALEKGKLSGMVNAQAALVMSLEDLRAAVIQNTVALTGGAPMTSLGAAALAAPGGFGASAGGGAGLSGGTLSGSMATLTGSRSLYDKIVSSESFQNNCAAVVNDYIREAVGGSFPKSKSATDNLALARKTFGAENVHLYGYDTLPVGGIGMFGEGGTVGHTAIKLGGGRWLENKGFSDKRDVGNMPFMYGWDVSLPGGKGLGGGAAAHGIQPVYVTNMPGAMGALGQGALATGVHPFTGAPMIYSGGAQAVSGGALPQKGGGSWQQLAGIGSALFQGAFPGLYGPQTVGASLVPGAADAGTSSGGYTPCTDCQSNGVNAWIGPDGVNREYPPGVNPNGSSGGGGDVNSTPFSIDPATGGQKQRAQRQRQDPAMTSLNALAGLPVSAFTSGHNFLAAGGIGAALSGFTAGNPLLGIGVKLIEGLLLKGEHQKIPLPTPVAIVEVKDTAMDVFNLTQSRIAYSDTFSRRQLIAKPMTLPRGS